VAAYTASLHCQDRRHSARYIDWDHLVAQRVSIYGDAVKPIVESVNTEEAMDIVLFLIIIAAIVWAMSSRKRPRPPHQRRPWCRCRW
jgi:hypothetical protein